MDGRAPWPTVEDLAERVYGVRSRTMARAEAAKILALFEPLLAAARRDRDVLLKQSLEWEASCYQARAALSALWDAEDPGDVDEAMIRRALGDAERT